MRSMLLDERSDPPLRTVLGSLLKRADSADFAVAHVRLGAIDLSDVELARVRTCRLLLDRLDVDMLADVAHIITRGGPLAANLALLYRFAASGRIHIRSSASLRWSPDFSVMRGLPHTRRCPHGAVCLVGAHYFSRPVAVDGASFTCALTSRLAIETASRRFDELWVQGHDVLPVVHDFLRNILQGRAGDDRA